MGFVDYEVDGHVAVITINRPKALNALNEDVLKDIEAAFDAVDLSENSCNYPDRRRREIFRSRC